MIKMNKQKKKHSKRMIKKSKVLQRKLLLSGMNCAGINSKWQSFNKLINDVSPGVFFLQETKLTAKQKFKIDNQEYVIFRLERKQTGGGGLVLGALADLKPVLVREGNDEAEAITIMVEINKLKIRLVVGGEMSTVRKS